MSETITIEEFRQSIKTLEDSQVEKGNLLKEQFYFTYESLKPANLIKGMLQDISSSPDLLDSLIGTSVGQTTGFLLKKIFVGSSKNPFRKVLGAYGTDGNIWIYFQTL